MIIAIVISLVIAVIALIVGILIIYGMYKSDPWDLS